MIRALASYISSVGKVAGKTGLLSITRDLYVSKVNLFSNDPVAIKNKCFPKFMNNPHSIKKRIDPAFYS